MEHMTTKQIAEAAGLKPDSIRKIAKRIYPHKVLNGKASKWSKDEAQAILNQASKKNMVEPQKKSEVSSETIRGSLSDDDLTKIAMIVDRVVMARLAAQDDRIQALEEKVEEKQPLLPPPVDPRSELNRIIRKYSSDTGNPYAWVWTSLYKEYRDRYHVDIPLRAKNIGMSPMEYAKAEDLMLQLVGLARHLYGGAA